jgi:hypothetical protein
MAEDTTPPPIPLGAQLMRKMYAGCKGVMDIVTQGHGTLDECEAKNTIAEHMKAIGACMGGMSKAFARYYKGIELEEAPVENPSESLNKVPDKYRDQGSGNADYLANKRRNSKNIKNTDDDMDPTEKAMIATRIKMLESKIRHAERLQRVARSRR